MRNQGSNSRWIRFVRVPTTGHDIRRLGLLTFTELRHFFVLAICLLLLTGRAWSGEPYTPGSDDTVIAHVSPRATKGPSALRDLRRGIEADPTDIDRAVAYARQAIVLGRERADPRYFGYAEAVLAPWWQQPAPPAALRYQRAVLRQRRHDFAGALDDLDALLQQNPRDAEARLSRAVIHQVQGRPLLAQSDCAALIGGASLLTVTTCLAASGGVGGHAAQRYPTLVAVLATPAGADAPTEERRWATTVAAELAARLRRSDEAEAWFVQAWTLAERDGVDDVYLQAAWADFQLEQDDAIAVVARLSGRTADASLLRLAIAEKRLADAGNASYLPQWKAHADQLARRFQTARARGEYAHGREESMFALHLRGNANAALRHALRNWQNQREPADARILLEAALAAHDPATVASLRDWLLQTGLEDPVLRKLAGVPGDSP
jgi:tetratricopeptide (TPR) repeat protein